MGFLQTKFEDFLSSCVMECDKTCNRVGWKERETGPVEGERRRPTGRLEETGQEEMCEGVPTLVPRKGAVYKCGEEARQLEKARRRRKA
eukprot:scaffold149_cov315-Pinguiococcus_pyrenoidosus.AAC.28